LLQLALFFLKVGAILYGSGYVLIAYVEGEVVDTNGWLTRAELVDAVAIGQFTPGPILSTATFIGYVVMARDGGTGAGIGGAVVASCAIFLPSFLFVAAVGPLIPRLRRSPWTAALLDAVNAASVGLMAAVTLVLCRDAVTDWRGLLILAASAAAVFRWNINSVWIVLGGAAVGWLLFGGG
jgi:chromate transporter